MYTIIYMTGDEEQTEFEIKILMDDILWDILSFKYLKDNDFVRILYLMGIQSEIYLTIAKKRANRKGYNSDLLEFSKHKDKKLNYNGVNFGSVKNKDFIMYIFEAYKNTITIPKVIEHRDTYLKMVDNTEENWKNNPESPENLEMNILW